MRVVYMGTPDFAVPPLSALHREGHEIVGVYSQPDRPKGRGHKLVAPPVKERALELGIPVFQPEGFRDPLAVEELRALAPEVIVVAAYGRILPQSVLDIPRYGCVNIHASLLPRLRGAAPIQWSILRGDSVTGVTTMMMAAMTMPMTVPKGPALGSSVVAGMTKAPQPMAQPKASAQTFMGLR